MELVKSIKRAGVSVVGFLAFAVSDCRRTRDPLGSQRPGHWVLHGFVAGVRVTPRWEGTQH
jgi:hypothetical protein